jgi:hypothetical protein
MNFDVAIDRTQRYVRVTLSGAPSIGQLLSLVHLLGVESASWEQDAVLVDLRGLTTPLSAQEQFRFGADAAASLRHITRIASVLPADCITPVSERDATGEDGKVHWFDSEQDAIAWLCEE